MVYVVAVLLTSSLTITGLMTVWAATSQRHWFLRIMAYLGALFPLLLIPACEPFLAFALQGAIIAAGVTWIPWRDDGERAAPMQFSRFKLSTLLLILVPISLLASAFAISWRQLNQDAWQTILVIGLAGGFGTLIGWWSGTRKSRNWRVRCGVSVVLWVLISAFAARCDWFVVCMDNFADWPPDESRTDWGLFGVYDKADYVNIWYLILGAQIIFANYLIQESAHTFAAFRSRLRPRLWMSATLTYVFLSVVIVSPSVVVGFKFLTRHWVPESRLPVPNGYDDFLAACKLMPKDRLVDGQTFDYLEAKQADLQQALEELRPALSRVDEGLAKPTAVPVDYFDPECPRIPFRDFFTLRWGLFSQGSLALRLGDFDTAANRYLDLISFACSSSRGGFESDDQYSIYAADDGFQGFYRCLDQLSHQNLPAYIERMKRLEAAYEPAENYVRRTEIWGQRSRGWSGHMQQMFGYRLLPEFYGSEGYLLERRFISTIFHLFQTDLAIRAYKVDHEELPSELADLIPDYLPEVLTDPLSPKKACLRYRRDEGNYSLYSVGPNGKDDHGEKAWQSLSYAVHGDTFLSDQYAEEAE